MALPGCVDVPEDPVDGQVFVCPCCGYETTYAVLDGEGEWVS